MPSAWVGHARNVVPHLEVLEYSQRWGLCILKRRVLKTAQAFMCKSSFSFWESFGRMKLTKWEKIVVLESGHSKFESQCLHTFFWSGDNEDAGFSP